MASISVDLVPLQVPTQTSIKRPPARRENGIRPVDILALNDLDRDVVLLLLKEQHEAVMSNWELANSQTGPL
jgi:hypothetical protein